jgi:hypothetical protein
MPIETQYGEEALVRQAPLDARVTDAQTSCSR